MYQQDLALKVDMLLNQIKVSKDDDRSRGQPKGSFFNSYYTKV